MAVPNTLALFAQTTLTFVGPGVLSQVEMFVTLADALRAKIKEFEEKMMQPTM
jgi:hypothetical protein